LEAFLEPMLVKTATLEAAVAAVAVAQPAKVAEA
jgi:hypothetical protein